MVSQSDPVEHTIEARTLGRYLVAPPRGMEPAPLLVGFHGYGENAELHLEALCAIPGSERWRIASVQGLHRFYERRTGRIELGIPSGSSPGHVCGPGDMDRTTHSAIVLPRQKPLHECQSAG